MVSETDPSEVELLRARIAELEEENRRLLHNVEVFRRIAFGRGSEKRGNRKLPESASSLRQMHLWLTQLVEEADRTAEQTGAHGTIDITPPKQTDRKPGKRRQKLPSHLPRVRTTYALPEEQLLCECGCKMREIGEDVSSELLRVELTVVHEIAKKKYGCGKCGGAARTAPGPQRVIDKGLLSPSFLAHVITERFGMHLPYNRMEQQYADEGLDLSRSVLQRSAAKCGELLEPIYEQLGKDVLAQPVVHTDDTPVTVAQDAEGRTVAGRVWVYADHEDRIWYDFTPSRKRDGPARVLGVRATGVELRVIPGLTKAAAYVAASAVAAIRDGFGPEQRLMEPTGGPQSRSAVFPFTTSPPSSPFGGDSAPSRRGSTRRRPCAVLGG